VGFFAVTCSVFIYVVTKRKWWSGTATSVKFFGTAAQLGFATMTVTTAISAGLFPQADLVDVFRSLTSWFLSVTVLKLLYEASMFLHLRDKQLGDLKRTAWLIKREWRQVTILVLWLGGIGGVHVPALLLLSHADPTKTTTLLFSILGLLLAMGGEFLERTLFFTAVSAPRMPGAIGK
jgi:DMSO reductase anchor subunit